MKGNVWAIAVLFIGFIVLAPALNMAYADSTQFADANETTAVDYDMPYTLDNTDVETYTSLNVTANDTTLSNGTDYVFDRANATVEWVDTNTTSDGDTAALNYSYEYYDDTTQIGSDAIQGIAIVVGFVAVIAALGLIFKITGGGW